MSKETFHNGVQKDILKSYIGSGSIHAYSPFGSLEEIEKRRPVFIFHSSSPYSPASVCLIQLLASPSLDRAIRSGEVASKLSYKSAGSRPGQSPSTSAIHPPFQVGW